jgi:Zn-dependent protease with chaperone function
MADENSENGGTPTTGGPGGRFATAAKQKGKQLGKKIGQRGKQVARHTARKLVLTGLLAALVLVGMYSGYRKALNFPEGSEAFNVRSYSMGSQGDSPFYQTDQEIELTRRMVDLRGSILLSYLGKEYWKYYKEHASRGRMLTQVVKIGPDQLPDIYQMVTDACEVLGVDNVPSVYLTKSLGTSLHLTNRLSPKIVISSDFTWAFKPEELRFLLAGQVAHIRLGHVFYLDLVEGLRTMRAEFLPDFVSDAFLQALLRWTAASTLLDWLREAEISADRGALTVVGDIEVALRALVKLNIGANYEDAYGPVNPDAYIHQIEKLDGHRIETASAAIEELENTNPFVTARCRHLKRWYETNPEIFK